MESKKRKLSSSDDEKDEYNPLNSGFSIDANPTNIKINTDFVDTSPEQEYHRSKLVSSFHRQFEEKCKSLFCLRFAPKNVLNVFLYEQLSIPKSESSNSQNSIISIPKPENLLQLCTLNREIIRGFPVTAPFKFFNGCDFKIEKHIKLCLNVGANFARANRLYVNESCLRSLLYDRGSMESSLEFFERFEKARDTYFEPLKPTFEKRIDDLKRFMLGQIEHMSQSLRSHQSVHESQTVTTNSDTKFVFLKYKDSEFTVSKGHYNKIKELFNLNKRVKNGSTVRSFDDYLYCLICRYQTFFRNDQNTNEGYGLQAAVPARVFKELNVSFGVTQEMFASPFNCYFKNYCSAFLDTDFYFGSNGSFFEFEPTEGI